MIQLFQWPMLLLLSNLRLSVNTSNTGTSITYSLDNFSISYIINVLMKKVMQLLVLQLLQIVG